MPLDRTGLIDPQSFFIRPRTPQVFVSVVADPVDQHRQKCSFGVAVGSTVLDIAFEAGYAFALDTIVIAIGDHIVDEVYWRNVRPKAGVRIRILTRFAGGGGGDSKALRSVLMIAVAVAAAAVAGPLAGPAGLGFALESTGFLIAKAVIATAITAVGRLAVGALAPPPSQDNGPGRTTGRTEYQITQQSNSARPFEPIRVVGGRRRVYPDLWGEPIYEYEGNTQYMSVPYNFGWGPFLIENLRVGETSFAEIEGLEYELIQGFDGDPKPTLYRGDHFAESISTRLPGMTGSTGLQTIATTDPVGTVRTENGAEDGLVRTTLADVDGFAVNLSFRGLYQSTRTKGIIPARVTFKIEYSPTGENNWTRVDVVTKVDDVRNPFSWGRSYSVPKGQYDIRVTRMQNPFVEGSEYVNEIVWSTLVSIKERDIYPLANQAYLVIRVKASEATNGQIQAINADVTTICPDWDPETSTWITRPTRNPASLLRYLLQGPFRRTASLDEDIDLLALQDWAEYCLNKGLTSDALIENETSAYEALRRIASVGEASVAIRDGKVSVVRDRSDEEPVTAITSADCIAGSLEVRNQNDDLPHALRVRFYDADGGWDEDLVYADGYDSFTATRFETLILGDIDNWPQAYRMGRLKIAEIYNRPRTISFSVDWTGLLFERGDPFVFTHLSAPFTQSAGMIKTATVDGGGDYVGIQLDRSVTMDAGQSYRVRIRDAYGKLRDRDVTTVVGEVTTLSFVAPMTSRTSDPVDGALLNDSSTWMFGRLTEQGRKLIVTGIQVEDFDQFRIICQDAAPEILSAADGPIPAHQPGYYIPPANALAPPKPVILSITTESLSVPVSSVEQQQVTLRIELKEQTGPAAIVYREVQAKLVRTTLDYQRVSTAGGDQTIIRLPGFTLDETYLIRVRSHGTGQPSAWSDVTTHLVRRPADTRPPMPVVQALRLVGKRLETTFEGANCAIQWNEVASSRPSGLETVVADQTGNDATLDYYKIEIVLPLLSSDIVRTERIRGTRFTYIWDQILQDTRIYKPSALYPTRQIEMRVYAVGTAGEQSPAPATIRVSNPAPSAPTLRQPDGLKVLFDKVIVRPLQQADPDFDRWKVYVGTAAGFTRIESTGPDNNMLAEGVVSPLVFEATPGTRYYVFVEAWDQYGPGGVTAQLTVDVPLFDANGFIPPGTLSPAALVQNVQDTLDLVPLVSAQATSTAGDVATLGTEIAALDARVVENTWAAAGVSAGYTLAMSVSGDETVIGGFRLAVDNGGLAIEALTLADVTDAPATVSFTNTYETPPIVFAQVATHRDIDPVDVLPTAINQTSATLFLREDTSADAETAHAAEDVDLLVVQRPRRIAGRPYGDPTAPIRYIGEVFVAEVGRGFAPITLDHAYTNPAVIFSPQTSNAGTAEWAAVTSVTATGLQLGLLGLSADPSETVGVMVIEAGSWALPDGTRLDAGVVVIDQLAVNAWHPMAFDMPFSTPPVVLSRVSTLNDGFAVTRHRAVTAAGFEIALNEGESTNTSGHGAETIGWVAMGAGVYALDDVVEGSTVDAAFLVDSFRVINPMDGTPVTPLAVYDGRVYIDDALIREITADKIVTNDLMAIATETGALTVTGTIDIGAAGQITAGSPTGQGVTIDQNGIVIRQTDGMPFFDANGLAGEVIFEGNIHGGAVSNVWDGGSSVAFTLTANNWVSIEAQICFAYAVSDGVGHVNLNVGLGGNGTWRQYPLSGFVGSGQEVRTVIIRAQPGIGSHTITIAVADDPGGGSATWTLIPSKCAIIVTLLKK